MRHLYTVSPDEVASAIQQHGFSLEGVACYVYPTQASGTTPLQRLHHKTTFDYFYTADPTEALAAIANNGYEEDGVACHVYGRGSQPPNSIPLYRRSMPRPTKASSENLYTTDPHELPEGFVDNGIYCYVFDPGHASNGTIPFYRLLGPDV